MSHLRKGLAWAPVYPVRYWFTSRSWSCLWRAAYSLLPAEMPPREMRVRWGGQQFQSGECSSRGTESLHDSSRPETFGENTHFKRAVGDSNIIQMIRPCSHVWEAILPQHRQTHCTMWQYHNKHLRTGTLYWSITSFTRKLQGHLHM